MKPDSHSEAEASRAVIGGEKVEVTYRTGKKETILLRELTYRQLHEFGGLLRDDRMPELLELCAGKEAGWSDQLTIESAADLAGVVLRANFPQALEAGKKDQALGAKIAGFLSDLARVANLSAGFASSSASLLVPSSSESAEETGSGS